MQIADLFSAFSISHQRSAISSRIRPVAQLAEHRSPKPGVGGSIPSWPARAHGAVRAERQRQFGRRMGVGPTKITRGGESTLEAEEERKFSGRVGVGPEGNARPRVYARGRVTASVRPASGGGAPREVNKDGCQ